MNPGPDENQYRANLLSVFLSLIAACAFLVFTFLLCGGMSLYVLAVIGGLFAFGLLHYVLWGQAMTKEVEGERAESEMVDERQSEDWPRADSPWHRRP